MGGVGSGRRGGYPTSEATASYVLRTSLFTGLKLRPGIRGGGTISFGEERFPVQVTIDTTAEPYLELLHATRDSRRSDDDLVRYQVPLLRTVPTYGGERWWFQCPCTRRRAAKLYLPNGGWFFWSRPAGGAARSAAAPGAEAPPRPRRRRNSRPAAAQTEVDALEHL